MSSSTTARTPRDSDLGGGQPFVRYYRVLREHVWLVALCTVVVVAVAAIYVKLAPRMYQAQAELVVTPAASNNAVLNQMPVQQSTGDPTTDTLTAAALVTTTQVANAVISGLQLHNTTPGALLANVQATPVGQTSIVAVQAEASSPAMAQALANAFVRQRIASSTAVMHRWLASEIPGLEASIARIPPAAQNGPGSLGEQLDQYKALLTEPDPTLGIAELAASPTAPYTPKTKLTLVAALLAGLLIGVAAAFGLNALDPRLRREEQLRSILSAPILARIPREPRRKARRPLLPSELSFVSHEGYRRLRTTLAARRSGGGARTILITGSSPSEGKTTTAINLAFALAQSGVRVILIEADLRRPTIASTLSLEPAFGTAEVLAGEIELADALVPLAIDETSLRVLPAARAGDDLAEGLSKAVARKLMSDAQELADFVVIDSPPLTAVVDALPLAQFAAEVLVVARLGRTRLGKLEDLDELLAQLGASVTGLVLVGQAPARGSAYYHYAGEYGNPPRGTGQRSEADTKDPGAVEASRPSEGRSKQSGMRRSDRSSTRRSERAGSGRSERAGSGRSERAGSGRSDMPAAGDRDVPEPSDRDVPEPSDRDVPEPSDRDVPKPSDRDVPEAGDRDVPEPSDRSGPEPARHPSR